MTVTPDKLEAIAEWMDLYDKFVAAYAQERGAAPELVAALRATDVQDDLRAWADTLRTTGRLEWKA